jgi:hypothetical protein
VSGSLSQSSLWQSAVQVTQNPKSDIQLDQRLGFSPNHAKPNPLAQTPLVEMCASILTAWSNFQIE